MEMKSLDIIGLGVLNPLDMAYLSGELEVIKYFEEGTELDGVVKNVPEVLNYNTEQNRRCALRNGNPKIISHYFLKNESEMEKKQREIIYKKFEK